MGESKGDDLGGHQKVREYIGRINGGEDRKKVLQDLPPSFRDAIEHGIRKSEEDEWNPTNQPLEIIPPQWKGLTAEALAEIWTVPTYTDPEKTQFEVDRRRRALEYLHAQEGDQEESLILQRAENERLEEVRKKLASVFGETKEAAEMENGDNSVDKGEILESKEVYEKSLDEALEKLSNEKGIVEVRDGVPTIIVSDLHARKDFLEKVLALKDASGKAAIDLLREGKLNIVCVGDGMHSELPSNWTTTSVHYELNSWILKGGKMQGKFKQYKQMIERVAGKKYEDLEPAEIQKVRRTPEVNNFFISIEDEIRESLLEEEMARSLGLMKMVMDLKVAHPDNFHYVRGNHDDIMETLKGFEKFDGESARVKQWVGERFGDDFLNKYARFEASLPLLARGKDFVVSHAAPAGVLGVDSIINRDRQAALSLTWTDNTKGGSSEEIINKTLENLGMNDARWFIGHRGVDEAKVREQFNGKLIQINHDKKQLVAIIKDGKSYTSDQVYDLNSF